MRRNTLAPNVEVQSIIADGRPYEPSPGLKLPVSIRTLQVTYTALSLSIPERVRFRYRLRAGERGRTQVHDARPITPIWVPALRFE